MDAAKQTDAEKGRDRSAIPTPTMRAAPVSSLTRRAVSAALAALAGTAVRPVPAAEPTTLRASLEKVAQRPAYGIETADVYYPPWFAGRWRVTSALTKVDAPAGVELFSPGRNGTEMLRRAREEMNDKPLVYEVRWRRDGEDTYVVDRAFNVESISRASMGADAVQSTQANGADSIVMVLKPSGAPRGTLFQADLKVVSRRTDPPRDADTFDCAETVRQTVLSVGGKGGPSARPVLLKEVDTICLYERAGPDKITGIQRTATYLVPDATYTSDPSLAEQQAARLAMGPAGRAVAIDVRTYECTYERIAA